MSNQPQTFFRTHDGRFIDGAEFEAALNAVADDWAKLARDIREEDSYASHVTEERKEENLAKGLSSAERIRQGYIDNFTIWQRMNTKLTGKCVALLPD